MRGPNLTIDLIFVPILKPSIYPNDVFVLNTARSAFFVVQVTISMRDANLPRKRLTDRGVHIAVRKLFGTEFLGNRTNVLVRTHLFDCRLKPRFCDARNLVSVARSKKR